LKSQLTIAMTYLASDPRNIFVGYGLKRNGAMGTLANVPPEQLSEFTVAEGLMVSAAIGMSLAGLLPVVYLERFDFAMNAMDALVNHLLPAEKLSRGEFRPALIIRATVGNKTKPNFTGPVHTQSFSEIFRTLGFTVYDLIPEAFAPEYAYMLARERQLKGQSTIVVDYKDYIS